MLKYIWGGSQTYTDINARYYILKIHERIKQTQNECKGAEISSNSMGKGLHKVFKSVVN